MMLITRTGIVLFALSCILADAVSQSNSTRDTVQGNLSILPWPTLLDKHEGFFVIDDRTFILTDSFPSQSFDPLEVFRTVFKNKSGYAIHEPKNVVPRPDAKQIIRILHTPSIENTEGYSLTVHPTEIVIRASHEQGAFYAMQTLRQIMRMDALPDVKKERKDWSVPAVEISDQPQFGYRGLHLDVCRHYMPLDFVKKYIDLLAYYKMNRFHWHLTDDQGWRIEIKQYPKLQEIAAWREETLVGHYKETPDVYDGIRHGGFYTQEEIKEVVAYAALRGVTIIPEIEMPGHALAALSAYPELACTPGPFKAATTWGVFDDVFCPNEETFTFLENVLDEVMELFPSKYIHIGGDECPKTRWKESAFCQALMRKEGLKDEHELQSYFIQRIEKYLNSNGRNIIGWDEILEGGLAPNATVMSWRGVSGGVAAAQSGHDAIMTPGTHCYFDHYQADPAFEPVGFGGLTTLEKVYSFNPVPSKLTSKEATHILGAQGNLWTEYIASPAHAEYMAYPRAIALAEVLWTPASQKDWKGFVLRLSNHLERLDGMNVNYAKQLTVPTAMVQSGPEGLIVKWKTDLPDQQIFYTRDTSSQTWNSAFSGESNSFAESGPIFYRTGGSGIKKLTYQPTKARNATISAGSSPSGSYPGRQGLTTLIDGLEGKADFNGEDWCAWNNGAVTIDLNLNELIRVDSLEIGTLSNTGAWIHMPQSIDIETSVNGQTFKHYGKWVSGAIKPGRNIVLIQNASVEAKYLRLTISPITSIPDGLPGAGRPAWTFIDEISVY
jgi:hexosaminidase